MPIRVRKETNKVVIYNPTNNTRAVLSNYSKDYNVSNFRTTNLKPEEKTSRFKLVVVRDLSETNNDFDLAQSYVANYGSAAATVNSPSFPPPIFQSSNLNTYGVYVDPDLYDDPPVFIFQSPSSRIKAFITANGNGKDAWSVHLVYVVAIGRDEFALPLIFWRIATIDNIVTQTTSDLKDETLYFLDAATDICNIQLPLNNGNIPIPTQNIEFVRHYDISNITYCGGGLFNAYGMDWLGEGVPSYAADTGNENGVFFNFDTNVNKRRKEIYRNISPKSHFSWIRGNLKIDYSQKSASYEIDPLEKGHIKTNFKSDYEIKLTLKPEYKINNVQLTPKIEHVEFCNSTVVFIENTNRKINSTRREYDYGTSPGFKVIKEYTQKSNCLRQVSDNNLLISRTLQVEQPYKCFPFFGSSYDGIVTSYLVANGTGEITHSNFAAAGSGSRGVTYFWGYPSWFALGTVSFATIPSGQSLYFSDDTIVPVSPSYSISIDSTQSNKMNTSWSVPNNPPSGFFRYLDGVINFNFQYSCPPFFQHLGLYYYEDNPTILNDSGNRRRGTTFTGDFNPLSLGAFGSSSPTYSASQNRNALAYAYNAIV